MRPRRRRASRRATVTAALRPAASAASSATRSGATARTSGTTRASDSAAASGSEAAGSPATDGAGRTVTVSIPSAAICASVSRRAPSPTEDIATTAATPNTTPRIERLERSLWSAQAARAEPQQHDERGAHGRSSASIAPVAQAHHALGAAAERLVVRDQHHGRSLVREPRPAVPRSPRRCAVSRLPVGSSASSSRGDGHQRARDCRPLRLAARELGGPVIGAVGEPDALERAEARAAATRRAAPPRRAAASRRSRRR